MKKKDIEKGLSWFNAENYGDLKDLTLTEIYLELKIRATFNISKLMHLGEVNMLEQIGHPDGELPKLKDANTDFNFWMRQIINGNPLLSKQIISVNDSKEIKSMEDAYRLDTYFSLPDVHLVTFDNLEHLYLKAKEKLGGSTAKDFSRQISSVYNLFEKTELNEFTNTIFQASLRYSTDQSMKQSFASLIPVTRSTLGIKEPSSPSIEKKKNQLTSYSINLSFFKTIYTQKLIQLSDCINWFALHDEPLNKAVLIKTIYNDVALSTANIYQTHFKNVSLINDQKVSEALYNILRKNSHNQIKSLSHLIEELRLEDIQKNKNGS